jgi:hypothetical protein
VPKVITQEERDALCVIQQVSDLYYISLSGMVLSVGWDTRKEAQRFCERILGVDAWSYRTDSLIAASFNNQRRYRVSNVNSISSFLGVDD